jgi:UDP-N-acetylglucosamine--N-acetylmuramyl-(pentapeptide) pyrophosphoryl-undecaprenol N-acetylglucosamine transferase
MQDAYSAATLAVVRSGAASLTELAFFQLPSILIPYPFAAEDHQTRNARVFERVGAGVLLPESGADAQTLAAAIRSVLAPQRHALMRAACGSLYVPDAAERVAGVLLESVMNVSGKEAA